MGVLILEILHAIIFYGNGAVCPGGIDQQSNLLLLASEITIYT